MEQAEIDAENARFWDELCGSGLAKSLSISDRTPASLARFDGAFLALYPYLRRYMERMELRGKRVLEIGLGFGTVGEMIARHGADYHGLDIADSPVMMMRHRLRQLELPADDRVVRGSALAIPHPAGAFDAVVTIGCLHHTGDIPGAVDEVRRVLRQGGVALVMLYNAWSFRQLLQVSCTRLRAALAGSFARVPERIRAMYDTNLEGLAAPHTDYVSPVGARRLFRGFSDVRVDIQNFDSYSVLRGLLSVPRRLLLGNVARVLGLDLYITARK